MWQLNGRLSLRRLHGALITGVTVVDIKQLKQVGPVPPGGGIYAARLREKRLTITEERIETAIERLKKNVMNQISRQK